MFYESVYLCNKFFFSPVQKLPLALLFKIRPFPLTCLGGSASLMAVVKRVPCLRGHCLLFGGVVFIFWGYVYLLNNGVQSEGPTVGKGTLFPNGSFRLMLYSTSPVSCPLSLASHPTNLISSFPNHIITPLFLKEITKPYLHFCTQTCLSHKCITCIHICPEHSAQPSKK